MKRVDKNLGLYIAFFVSGFCALLYQVSWQRMLSLYLGSDVVSATIVVACFLAGLGLGGLLAARFVRNIGYRRLIQIFALSQIGIALFAFLSKLLFYDFLFLRLSTVQLDRVSNFFVILFLLSLPTTLMGITLPVLSQAIAVSAKDAPAKIARLNGINVLGSVLGTLLSGWVLITVWGYENTIYFGAILSLATGFMSLYLSSGVTAEIKKKPLKPRRDGTTPIVGWALYVFLAGFIAISLEIIWFRFIGHLMASEVYTFAHLLAFILIGYSIGNLVGSRWVSRIVDVAPLLFLVQIGIVAYSTISIWVILSLLGSTNIVDFFATLNQGISTLDSSSFLLGYLAFPMLLIFPANFLIGLYFPLIQRLIQTDQSLIGNRVAIIQVSNILGNVLGSIVTGLFLFDLVGTSGALRALSVIGIGFGIALLFSKSRRIHRVLAGASLLVLGAVTVLFPNNTRFWTLVNDLTHRDAITLMVEEDSTGVSTLITRSNLPNELMILVNGQFQGGIPFKNRDGHTYLGFLAALLHNSPESVFVIGIGSANTPILAGANGETQHIYAVEIVGSEIPLLLEAESMGFSQVSLLFGDPRFEIAITDGRRALMAHTGNLDVIEADAIRPRRSGSGFLYSKEFFETQLAKLSDDGFVIQWSPTGRTMRTFASVFPYVLEFPDVQLLIGSKNPLKVDFEQIISRVEQDSFMQAYMQSLDIEIDIASTIRDLRPLVMCDAQVNPALANDINTDLHPKDEYFLFEVFEGNRLNLSHAIEVAEAEGNTAKLLELYAQQTSIDPSRTILDRWINVAKRSNDPTSAIIPLEKIIALLECETSRVQRQIDFANENGFQIEDIQNVLIRKKQDAYNHILELGDLAARHSQYGLAVENYERAAQYEIATPDLFLSLGNAKNALGEIEGAIEAYETVLSLGGGDTRLLARIGESYFEIGNHEKALTYLLMAAERQPDAYEVRFSLGRVYLALGMNSQAIAEFELVLELTEDEEYIRAAEEYLEDLEN